MNTETKNQTKPRREDIGALWRRLSSRGIPYYSGQIIINQEFFNIIVFEEKNKKSNRAPDLRIYMAEDRDDQKENNSDSNPSSKPYIQAPTIPQVVEEVNKQEEEEKELL